MKNKIRNFTIKYEEKIFPILTFTFGCVFMLLFMIITVVTVDSIYGYSPMPNEVPIPPMLMVFILFGSGFTCGGFLSKYLINLIKNKT